MSMVSCLTVFNLAADASEREVHVLFSGCTGYSRCAVVPPKEHAKPYAFVQFDTQENAMSAMELRQGTCWDAHMPPVRFELAKKNMPDHFGPRQPAPAHYQPPAPAPAPVQPPAPAHHQNLQPVPPPKRQRVDSAAVYVPPVSRGGPVGGGGTVLPPAVSPEGPRTLHVGGLPPGLTQADLDHFLSGLFKNSVTGSKLHSDDGVTPGRAFVGFTTHRNANSALSTLQGFDWEGSLLQASWARKELNVHHVGVAGAPPPPDSGGGGGVWESPAPRGKSGKGGGKHADAYAPPNGGGARCTIHLTGLPFVSEDDFQQHLVQVLGDDVIGSKFVDKRDGRPPVAWVRMADEQGAELVVSQGVLDIAGTQAAVAFSRTELDTNKVWR